MIFLIINSIAYLLLFLIYQIKKKKFDLGSLLLIVWTLGSAGSVWYYTFPYVDKFYPDISIIPFIYLFIINLFIFFPFLKTKYNSRYKFETSGIKILLRVISTFFAIINLPVIIMLLYDLVTFKFVGDALAEMYGAEEDRATLLFPGPIKYCYSVIRHFSQFIIFLFFYNLTIRKNNKLRIYGLGLVICTFFIYPLLGGSRGGMAYTLLSCLFYYFFLKNNIIKKRLKLLNRIGLVGIVGLVLGVSAISVSRLTGLNRHNSYRDTTMDMWIAQYCGEGIIQFDDVVWRNPNTLNGYQTLPYFISFFDPITKDVKGNIARNNKEYQNKSYTFFTYAGDIFIDFGKIGGTIILVMLGLLARTLIKVRHGKISMFKLIYLNYVFMFISIGVTSDVYRTYYTQIELVYVSVLLLLLYVLKGFSDKRY